MFSPMPTLHVSRCAPFVDPLLIKTYEQIAGMACSLLYPAFFETIAILGPGSAPLSVDIANQVLRFGHVDGALYPPSLLEDICRSAAALETIKTLKFVIFGGSPLKKAVGDLLSKQVKLMDYIGSTEVGSYPLFQLEPTDWDYFRFHPFFEFEMEPRSGGTYELVLHHTDKSKDFSSIFHLYPHLKEYRTKDLWLKHPTKKDLWRYHGRTDDLIVLSHGEDLDPTHMEAVIQRHARVRSAIVAGEGRIRPFLLLEPVVDSSSSDEDRKEMIDDIWPIVQVANGLCSEYVKLTRPLIVITSPEKPLKRLAKGSVDRRDSLREYQLEIDAVYDGVEPKTGE